LLYINDQFYSSKDFQQQFERFEQLPILESCDKRRVAVCTENVFEWLSLFFYIQKKGGSVVPIHSATPRDAAIRIAHRSSSHLLFFGTIDTPILLINEREEETGVLVQMSSGTTGEPKCIERTWFAIDEEIDNYNSRLPAEEGTVSIISCPVTHSYGLISGVLTAIKRGTVPIIITQLNPRFVMKKLLEYPNHILYAAPVFIHTVVRLLPETIMLDKVMISGTLIPSLWLEDLIRKSNSVLQQYGCSEAGCVSIQPTVSDPKEMGRPLPHLIVAAGTSEENPKEIIIKHTHGTIHTKDIGYFNQKGDLCLLGRLDDMINVAGLNVYPQEVEDVLMKEPNIEEVVVYKKPDTFAGERVCAQFVAGTFLDEGKLREWCRQRLAKHQVPVEFIQVKEIPKLPNGKVSRKLVGGMLA
jgi:fatty-acyl-CoA synthase